MANVYNEALLWLTPTNPFQAQDTTRQTVITYAFGDAGTYAVYSPESSVDSLVATSWQTYERQAAENAMKAWSNVANISITPAQSFDQATLHLLTTNEAGMRSYFSGEKFVQAFSTLPNNYGLNYGLPEPNYSRDWAAFNTEGYGWTQAGLLPGGTGYVTLLHEVGHLLGLDHPWDEKGWYVDAKTGARLGAEPSFPGARASNNTGDYGLNQGIYTTMSYGDGWNGQPGKGTSFGYQMGPGAFDIAAVQELYGPNLNYKATSDVYTLPTSNTAGTGWLTLWDTGGIDTISAETAKNGATIDLRPATLDSADGAGAGGYVSWINGIQGGFTIAHPNSVTTAIIENAIGGAYADIINGNNAANQLAGNAGNDTINGFAGSDVIIGGLGKDVMTGGADADTFVFLSAGESKPGNNTRDVITDFSVGFDQIDFSDFDANNRLDGEQAFSWLGADQFHKSAGELRFSNGVLQADVNGDAKADFEVALDSVIAMNQSDFLLT